MPTLQQLTMPGVVNQLMGDVPGGMSEERLLTALMQMSQPRRRARITPRQAAVREAQSMRSVQNILMTPQLQGTYGKGGTMPRLGSAQAPFTGFSVEKTPGGLGISRGGVQDYTPAFLKLLAGIAAPGGDAAVGTATTTRQGRLQEAINIMATGKRKRAAAQYTKVATKKARERLVGKARKGTKWLADNLMKIMQTASLAAPPTAVIPNNEYFNQNWADIVGAGRVGDYTKKQLAGGI